MTNLKYNIKKLTFTSSVNNQQLSILVLLPPCFQAGNNYDVYLVFDGNDLIMKTPNITENITTVAVFIAISSTNNYQRFNDLSTYRNYQIKPLIVKYLPHCQMMPVEPYVGGAGLQLINMLRIEIIPLVEKTFNFKSKDFNLLGCSMGAYLALQMLYLSALTFKKVLLFSPSIWFNRDIIGDLQQYNLNHNQPLIVNLWVGLKEPHYFEKTIAIDYYQDSLIVKNILIAKTNIKINFTVSDIGGHGFKWWIAFLNEKNCW